MVGRSHPQAREQKATCEHISLMPVKSSSCTEISQNRFWDLRTAKHCAKKDRRSSGLVFCWLCSGGKLVFSLALTRTPKSSWAELPPSQSVPSLYQYRGLDHPRSRTLHFSLLNFMRSLSAPSCLDPSEGQPCPHMCSLQPPGMASSAQ